jgi:hypothetical protein
MGNGDFNMTLTEEQQASIIRDQLYLRDVQEFKNVLNVQTTDELVVNLAQLDAAIEAKVSEQPVKLG